MQNNKPRLVPTHFIETWRNIHFGRVEVSPVLGIECLRANLAYSEKSASIETLTVIKIKYKNQ